MPPTALSPERQNELAQQLIATMMTRLPDGFATATATTLLLGSQAHSEIDVVDEAGRRLACWTPTEIYPPLRQLRAGMYRGQVGTWFEVELTVASHGASAVRYNYDAEPAVDTPATVPEMWAIELREFPRAPEYIPGWMRAKIAAAPNVYGVVHGPQDPRMVAEEFTNAGWQVRSAWRGEYTFDCDWASLRTLSRPGAVRFTGKVDIDRADELETSLARLRWYTEGALYGDDCRLRRQLRVMSG